MTAIVDYLTLKGFVFHRSGDKYFTNSPFNENDHTPSFVVFHDNKFKCFSTGKFGDITTLAAFFGDSLSDLSKIKSTWVAPKPVPRRPWPGHIPIQFLTMTDPELEDVLNYAAYRRIISGFEPGKFFTKDSSGFKSHPAILFPHTDVSGKIIGGKFRAVHPIGSQRFSSSGILGFYVLENLIEGHYKSPEFLLVESETSANSLWEVCKLTNRNVVICSAGAVSTIPKTIPTAYQGMAGRVLIDYDGSEALYSERISRYNHLKLTPVKMILPKGEDVNSLWMKNETSLIENLL